MTGSYQNHKHPWRSPRETKLLAPHPGSPVSLDYFDNAPFAFNGTLGTSTTKT
jgi:hypothetical protein